MLILLAGFLLLDHNAVSRVEIAQRGQARSSASGQAQASARRRAGRSETPLSAPSCHRYPDYINHREGYVYIAGRGYVPTRKTRPDSC